MFLVLRLHTFLYLLNLCAHAYQAVSYCFTFSKMLINPRNIFKGSRHFKEITIEEVRENAVGLP